MTEMAVGLMTMGEYSTAPCPAMQMLHLRLNVASSTLMVTPPAMIIGIVAVSNAVAPITMSASLQFLNTDPDHHVVSPGCRSGAGADPRAGVEDMLCPRRSGLSHLL